MDAGRALDEYYKMAMEALKKVFPGDEIYQALFMWFAKTFSISRLIMLKVFRRGPGLDLFDLRQIILFCFACPMAYYLTLRIGTSQMSPRA